MTREEAINHLKTVAKTATDSGYDSAVVDAVDMAREALEQEPKTGHWIETGAEELPFGITVLELTCSTCGWNSALIIPRNYCPKCGTKMESEEKAWQD